MEDKIIHLGHVYSVQLRGYDAWGKYVMNLIIFKHKISAFHPEAVTSFCRDKCHQLRYFICTLNDKAKIIFILGDRCAFDKVENSTRKRYCPVRMHNKDKPKNKECTFSSWQMPSIILYIVLMCTKVIIQQILTSTH